VRKPDGSLIIRDRLPSEQLDEAFLTLPPDLAIEVVSPNDLAYEVEEKVEEYRGQTRPDHPRSAAKPQRGPGEGVSTPELLGRLSVETWVVFRRRRSSLSLRVRSLLLAIFFLPAFGLFCLRLAFSLVGKCSLPHSAL
jgi:hypothetical protein